MSKGSEAKDTEMKDVTVPKVEEDKKEEPYDPFFGKNQQLNIDFRVQESDGIA